MAIANRAATPTNTAPLTLDQQRAADAWRCAQAQSQSKDYVNLAKGLPALIMNSGLLQVMAFLQEKGSKESQHHCSVVGSDMRSWLHRRADRTSACRPLVGMHVILPISSLGSLLFFASFLFLGSTLFLD